MLTRLIISAVIAFASPSSAQTVAGKGAIEALLVEVRQLRLALERSAVIAPKMQLTMQRLMLQEQKVARLSAQLDGIRREVAAHNAGVRNITQELPRLEQQITAETDPLRRKALEREHQQMKALAERTVDPQLLARESEVTGALQNERAVAQELTDKLASMERQLETVESPSR